MADLTIAQVKEFLGKLTVIEMADLVKQLEEEWGVSAAAPVAVAAVGGAPAAAAEEAEEKTEFDVVLTDAGAAKIQVIKAVREVTGLGLKEAKAAVDGAPSTLKEAVSKEEAEGIKAKIEAAGGKADIK
ncbi:MAG: 50S ribosomal protein L7/L12 [Deltaproteobacteria bacterium]|nr:MAG: 50S ribosomal protein L7/L12 [Deltaproteobacteria bacterium]